MKDNSSKQALLRKFLADECTEDELGQLAVYLQHDNQKEYDLVMQEVWQKMEANHFTHENDTADNQVSNNILSKITGKDELQVPLSNPAIQFKPEVLNWQRLAAVFVGILIVAASTTYHLVTPQNRVNQTTAFGQIRKVTLPDKSVVMLNGNSSIQYASEWDSDKPREVWLRGEAFFSVKHTKTDQKFLVYTQNNVRVEVLGTEFNVSTRNSKNQIVLLSGKVKLNLPGNFFSSLINQEKNFVVMQPGELVKFSSNPANYTKATVNPLLYCSWRNNELYFDNTSLREIIPILEDNYGLTVQVSDSTLLNQKVSGSMPLENKDLLLMALSRSLNLKIIKKARHVIIAR